MTSNDKKMLRVLRGESVNPPPVWLMRQAGRYLPEYRELRKKSKSFLNFCYTPEMAIEATLQPLRRYGFDAAIMFSDILVIPDALGQEVSFVVGEGPKLEPIRTKEALSDLSMDRLHDHLAPVYEVLKGLRRELPEETALIGFAGAPWTLACYMVEGKGTRDFQEPRTWAYTEPLGFGALIDLLVDSLISYLSRQIESGAEIIQLFDSWAGVLSPDQFRKWVINPNRRIVEALKKAHPTIPIIGFPRGAGLLYAEFARETKVDAVSVDQTIPVDWIRSELQPVCAVQGNIDNLALLAGGDALEREIDVAVDALASGPYIVNLGHGILQTTPPEHVDELLRRIAGAG